ncbi:MAG: hypothetical protein KDD58_09330 [Bdellovibrionales bacterium]|nr:hypothetical protein [Bdellovibrionales bacterium]
MSTRKRYVISSLFVMSSMAVFAIFQNCSDVKFESTDELAIAGIDGKLRQIAFSPKFNENRPDIDVTTILDNSNSMTNIQQNVKKAVSKTTSSLKGFGGTVSLYSTTEDLNHSARNKDKVNFYKIQDENGNLIPSTSFTDADLNTYKNEMDADGNPVFSTYEKWVKYINFSPFRTIPFTGNMNAEQFSAFQTEVFNEIDKFDISGSKIEVGLCSLLRNIDSYKDSNDFHTYIIATNEDDATTLDNCLKAESDRWDRHANEVIGPQQECDDTDEECTFSYSVSYQDEKWSKLTYKQSFTEWEKINFFLNGNQLKTVTTQVKHKTARRFARHKIKQRKWQFQYKRNVLIRYNDGIPEYEEQTHTANHNGEGVKNGICESGSTSFQTCLGDNLNYFNSNVKTADTINNSCQIKCIDQTSGYLADWIDTSNIPVSEGNVTFPSSVSNASLSGYTNGCNAWVAGQRSYNSSGVTDNLITNCELNFSSDGNTNNINKYKSENAPAKVVKSFGVCNATENTCDGGEKASEISRVGWGSINSNLITCSQSCGVSNLITTFNDSNGVDRVPADGLCAGKSAGDADDVVTDNLCSPSEKALAKAELQRKLSTLGISVTLYDSNISCSYSCQHRQGSEQEVPSSRAKLDPWAEPANESRSCADVEFTSMDKSNIHSCNKKYFNDNPKASISFNSTDGSICGANASDTVTLEQIMAHADASTVVDHGTDQPMKDCTVARFDDGRTKGSKGGVSNIEYSWEGSAPKSESYIGDEGVVKSVVDLLNNAHGGNYFIAAFINYEDPQVEDEKCKGVDLLDYYGDPSDPNYRKKKKRYKELAQILGPDKMKTFPACMPDYEESMKFVFDLIVTSASRSYKVALDEEAQEWVYRVKILDNKGLVHTIEKDQYSFNKGLLSFKEGGVNLDNAEIIYVDVVVPNPLTLDK